MSNGDLTYEYECMDHTVSAVFFSLNTNACQLHDITKHADKSSLLTTDYFYSLTGQV